MIFVTLGSQKFQFNRLLQKMDDLVLGGMIKEEVFAQTGYSDYTPNSYFFQPFLNRNEFATTMKRSDIVITHGGTGAIIGAVKQGKKVIAVPRLLKYGEHVDDHQLQLLKEFEAMNIIEVCYELENLGFMYDAIRDKSFQGYQSNTSNIIVHIEQFLLDEKGITHNEKDQGLDAWK